MDLLLNGAEPPTTPESRMKRYLKPLVVLTSALAALILTVARDGSGDAKLAAQTSRAAPQRLAPHRDEASLDVFTKVLGRVKESYVEPQRINPRQMLVAALDAVEQNVAEVLVEEIEEGKKLRVRVQDMERTFAIDDVDSLWILSSKIQEVFRFIEPHLQRSTEMDDVEYAATNGMLSTLDPHSILLTPEIYREMKLSTRGEFGGLGIVISMIQGTLTIMNPMKGTPATEVGLASCDQILKIGDESTVNMTLTQAVKRLRGAPGSEVDLLIKRDAWKKPRRKRVRRAVIKVDSVSSRMLSKKVGYIRLSSFQGNTTADLQAQLAQLKKKGMRGLVLDLRGNPGGLLDQSIKIADLFIDAGTLLTTVSDAGKRRDEKRASPDGTEARYPLVVLVDGGSASASEIVAGAVKQLDRGIVIGRSTFGKGSVQVIYDNEDDSALKLTIAQYLTPGDVSIQTTGIIPDVLTVPMVIRDDYIRLKKDHAGLREKDLSKHLTHTNTRAVKPLKP